MIYASNGIVTQGFSAIHPAVDIAYETSKLSYGSPIFAPENGTVTYVGQMGFGTNDAGLVVQIESGGRLHRLCHLASYNVKVGQKVSEGQQVGKMGFTGYTRPDNVIQGSHLHWVMEINGVRVDPRKYIEDDMYKGKTAKQWYDLAENRRKRLVAAEKTNNATIKSAQATEKALAVNE